MKKVLLFASVFCLSATFTFAQTEGEDVKEEVKIEMEQLQKEMEALRLELKTTLEEVKVDLQDIDIDLSGLDELHDMDWTEHMDDEEAVAYLNSEEFKQEMKKVQEEVDRAMEEARAEMAAVNWEEINKAIEEAMKEVERELSDLRRAE